MYLNLPSNVANQVKSRIFKQICNYKNKRKSEYKMELLVEELDVLYASEKILFTHNQEVVLAVPINHHLTISQTSLLKTILNKMAYPSSSCAWFYYEEHLETISIEEIIKCFSPKILLVIRPITDPILEPLHEKKSGLDVIFLPHPEKFEFTDSVKRPIWNLLKPFSSV